MQSSLFNEISVLLKFRYRKLTPCFDPSNQNFWSDLKTSFYILNQHFQIRFLVTLHYTREVTKYFFFSKRRDGLWVFTLIEQHQSTSLWKRVCSTLLDVG
jgi:hypothetical protein